MSSRQRGGEAVPHSFLARSAPSNETLRLTSHLWGAAAARAALSGPLTANTLDPGESASSTEFDGRFALTVLRSLSLLDFARRDPHDLDGVRDDMNGSAADFP